MTTGIRIPFTKEMVYECETKLNFCSSKDISDHSAFLNTYSNDITTSINELFLLIKDYAQEGYTAVRIREHNDKWRQLYFDHSHDNNIKKNAKELLKRIWTIFFDFTLRTDGDKFIISWKKNNRWFRPQFKISYEPTSSISNMMENLWKDNSHHDVTVVAKNDQTTTLHKCILVTIPFFKAYVNENFKTETIDLKKDVTTIKMLKIDLKQYSLQTVQEMVRHLYLKTFSDTYMTKTDNLIEMLYLSNYIGSKEMEEISLVKLNNDNLLNEETILQIADTAKELNISNLKELCSWYFRVNSNWFDNTEFDKITFNEIIDTYLIALEYKTEPLINKCIEMMNQKLKLDDNFITLCHHVRDTKDVKTKKFLVDFVKSHKEIYDILWENRDNGDQKKYSDAFRDALFQIDL